MARLLFGLTSLRGKLANYAQRFDLVEINPGDPSFPRPNRLSALRAEVPPSFAFSVVLPQAIATFDRSGAFGEALSRSLQAVKALEASAIVLCTTPSVRPTKANRKHLARLREKLPKDGCVVAWEARGLWEPEDFLETAEACGYLPIHDAALDELAPGPIAYTRIRALGMSTNLGADRLTTVARQLAGRREAYCVVDPEIASRVKAGLDQALQGLGERKQVPQIFRPASDLAADDEEQ